MARIRKLSVALFKKVSTVTRRLLGIGITGADGAGLTFEDGSGWMV